MLAKSSECVFDKSRRVIKKSEFMLATAIHMHFYRQVTLLDPQVPKHIIEVRRGTILIENGSEFQPIKFY